MGFGCRRLGGSNFLRSNPSHSPPSVLVPSLEKMEMVASEKVSNIINICQAIHANYLAMGMYFVWEAQLDINVLKSN